MVSPNIELSDYKEIIQEYSNIYQQLNQYVSAYA